jgi:DNA-binding transcriptional ArsR family regulator
MVRVMSKTVYHPNAYLTHRRNVTSGLSARTRILLALGNSVIDAKSLAEKTRLSYAVVMHHLHLLLEEKVVEYSAGKRYLWKLTGLGQRELDSFVR